jgi:transposase InsO family protein
VAQDRKLTQRLVQLYRAHQGRYGCPRLQHELRAEGCRVSRRRIARLMRAAGLRGRVARVYRGNPRLHDFFSRYPNRLPRRGVRRPDQVWVADVTYLPIAPGGWRYLAIVLDLYSRRVLAWTLGHRRDAWLVRTAFDAAVRRRRPRPGLIFHSDRGSEYAATLVGDRIRALGFHQSAAQRGPEDNPHAESFFHSLKAELIHGAPIATADLLRRDLARYVHYYNYRRRHSALGYRSPVDYEATAA